MAKTIILLLYFLIHGRKKTIYISDHFSYLNSPTESVNKQISHIQCCRTGHIPEGLSLSPIAHGIHQIA